MEGDKNKTAGGNEGTAAKSEVEKLAEKRGAEFIDNTHMGLLFAFMEKNPGVALEVFDLKGGDGRIGALVKRGDSIRVKLGVNFCGIDRGMNDQRFKLTPESARLISEFETQREMKQVVDDSRARFMTAWNPAPAEKVDSKEEIIVKIKKIVFRILQKGGNFAYLTRMKGRKGNPVSLSYKCDVNDGLSLLELASKVGILEDRGGGAKGFRLNDAADENDWLELLSERGFNGKSCMPVGVKIEESGKFILVYPRVDPVDKGGKP